MYRPAQALSQYVAARPRSLEKCTYFRRVRLDSDMSGVGRPDAAELDLFHGLTQAFKRAGHSVGEQPDRSSDLILTLARLPVLSASLLEQIPDVEPPLAQQISERYELGRLHPNLVVVVRTEEDLRGLPQERLSRLTRVVMTRVGCFKCLFLVAPAESPRAAYYMFTTMEGGHPVIERADRDCFESLRDRLVTHACAHDAGRFEPVSRAIPSAAWAACKTVDHLVSAGRRLGELALLEPPVDVAAYELNGDVWTSDKGAQPPQTFFLNSL